MSCSCGSNNDNNAGGACGGCKDSCGCGKSAGGKIWLVIAAVLIAFVAIVSAFKENKKSEAPAEMPPVVAE